ITWLCVLINLAIGVFLHFNGLVSFLSGVIIAGIPITISSSNSGSAWDNSKKIIEADENISQVITESFKLNKDEKLVLNVKVFDESNNVLNKDIVLEDEQKENKKFENVDGEVYQISISEKDPLMQTALPNYVRSQKL